MERVFGADLSAVRIHRSDVAPTLSARAFTVGSDVHFAPGQDRPSTTSGQELLAHELTHVVQQSGSRIRRATVVGGANDAAEVDAERTARWVIGRRGCRRPRVRSGGSSAIFTSSPLQRCLRDVHTLTQHFFVAPPTYEMTGKVLLGVEPDGFML
jgi:Domain of unknown function (DUF4157)/Acyl-CoA dehydrogenase, C-terminal domain